jgi:hypothetical protein
MDKQPLSMTTLIKHVTCQTDKIVTNCKLQMALQIAANTAYLFIMAFTLGYYFRDGYLALARRGAEGCYFS